MVKRIHGPYLTMNATAICSKKNNSAESAAVSMSISSANGAKQHSTSGIAASGAQVILA